MPTLEEFNAYVNALTHHDWHYDYSDDGSVYRRGLDVRKALKAKAASQPIYQQAYESWYDYVYKNISGITLESTLSGLRAQIVATTATVV